MRAAQVEQVRQFNRLVTQRVGALDDHFLGLGRPLGASRLLFEIGEQGADVRELRRRLGLDAGYVSRLIKRLNKEGLIRLAPGAGDQRVRTARLTARGRREMRELNARSDRLAAGLLAAVSPRHRERLVAAMSEVRRLLRAAGLVIERVDPASPAARWCWAQYFAELDRRFPGGFDLGTSLPVDDRDLVPPRGAFLVASIDGETVGGGCVKTIAPRVGYLKRMWVAEWRAASGSGAECYKRWKAKRARSGLRPCGSRPIKRCTRRSRCTAAPATARSSRSTTSRTPRTGSRSD